MLSHNLGLVALCLLPAASAYMLPPAPRGSTASVRMGLFDGVKEAFSNSIGEKPLVAADRVTPFDRWMGLDKELIKSEAPDESAVYIDPSDPANYQSYALSKPMGIAFVENEGGCGGVYVDEVLTEGSATDSGLRRGDQLVAVDGTLMLGCDFDVALDSIKGSSADATKLVFFRGPVSRGPDHFTPSRPASAPGAPVQPPAPHTH